jgi:hypothetical protein
LPGTTDTTANLPGSSEIVSSGVASEERETLCVSSPALNSVSSADSVAATATRVVAESDEVEAYHAKSPPPIVSNGFGCGAGRVASGGGDSGLGAVDGPGAVDAPGVDDDVGSIVRSVNGLALAPTTDRTAATTGVVPVTTTE